MPISFYELRGPTRPHKGKKGINDIRVGDGLFFVKSANSQSAPYLIAQEYICAELAKQIRLPIPPCFVGKDKGKGHLHFCSMNVTIGGGSAPVLDRPALAIAGEPDISTGLILFDIWVLNTDRKADNVSYMPSRAPQKLGIIDHSHTLFFYQDWSFRFKNALAIEGSAPDANRHVLLDFLNTTSYISKWLRRIKAVPNELIYEIVMDSVALGLPDFVARQAIEFLKERRDGLEALIGANQHEFKGISQWGLLWGT